MGNCCGNTRFISYDFQTGPVGLGDLDLENRVPHPLLQVIHEPEPEQVAVPPERQTMNIPTRLLMQRKSFVDKKLGQAKECLVEILNKRSSKLSYHEVYRNFFYLVLHKKGERILNILKEALTEHLINVRENVKNSVTKSNLLISITNEYNDYEKAMQMVQDVLMYLNNRLAENDKPSVFDIGVIIFKNEVIEDPMIAPHLRKVLLDTIRRERCGEITSPIVIKTTLQILSAVGMESQEVFENIFERPFLVQSAESYRTESQKLLLEESVSVGAYLIEVESRVKNEEERLKLYLNESTLSKVLKILTEELIGPHLRTITEMESGVRQMIEKGEKDLLKVTHKLFSRVSGGQQLLLQKISEAVDDSESKIKNCEEDPIAFIESVTKLCEQFSNLNISADVDELINARLKSAVNSNKRSAEYLSIFLDQILRTRKELDVDAKLDKTILVFRHLQDKDVFQRYYKQHLAKRLLLNKSVSDDNEKNMISKLKTECGCQFTTKLEGMFKDMTVSNTTMDEFKEHIASNLHSLRGVDLNVRVLTTGVWPLPSATTKGIIPQAPREAFEVFKRFYLNKHSGRRLTLNPQLGSADLNAFFYGPRKEEGEGKDGAISSTSSMAAAAESKLNGPRQHIIQVSTYQMCILVLFNHRDELTYDEILQTDIPEKDLNRSLQSLAMGKPSQRILTKTPKTKEIEPSDTFKVNDSFTSKLHRVKIQTVVAKGESELERKETRNKVDEDRKHEIEAAIVRIMKARKKLTHASLVAECTEQLKSRFLPSPVVIKKRIEELIEREYLARMTDDRKVYTYVA